MTRHSDQRSRSTVLRLVGLTVVLALGGCQGFGRSAKLAGTQSDRLAEAYPQLSTGRFFVLADFEQLDHYQICHVLSKSGAATCVPSAAGGVPETGERCLRATFASPLDALVVSNAHASTWSMRRDWRDFCLLVGAVQSPAEGLDLGVTLAAGPEQRAVETEATIRLRRGWNVIRLDLGEAADFIPIDDVREIRFSLPAAEEPVELAFDDLILADNREDLFGSSGDGAEGFYVQRQGRRLNVGAAGRFELAFANGQIVRWYDLGADPHRLRNLVGGGVLGPSPVVVSGLRSGSEPAYTSDFSGLGDTVVAHQEVIEANPVRVVMACTLRFTNQGQRPEESAPFQQWTYTVLRTGQVYAHLECTTQFGDWAPEVMGLVVSHSDDTGDQAWVRRDLSSARAGGSQPIAYAVVRPRAPARSGLVLAMHRVGQQAVTAVAARQDPRRIDLFCAEQPLGRPTQAWPCLLSVWPAGNSEEPSAGLLAADYADPAALEMQVGTIVTDSAGDRNGDGFNERFGCYVVEPEGDLVRLVIDGKERPRVSPSFVVRGTAGQQVWVYFDNTILELVAHDVRGDVLFQVPGTIRGLSLLEVVVRTAPRNEEP